MVEKKESNERLPSSAALFGLITELEAMIGSAQPLMEDEVFSSAGEVRLGELREEGVTLERQRLFKEKMVQFDTMAELEYKKSLMSRQLLSQHADWIQISPDGVDPLEQVQLRMTLWKYQQQHLKTYVSVLKSFRTHIEQYEEAANAANSSEQIDQWERQATAALQKLKVLLPTIDHVYRVNRFRQLLGVDASRPPGRKLYTDTQRQELQEMLSTLEDGLQKRAGAEDPVLEDIDLTTLLHPNAERQDRAFFAVGNELEGRLRRIISEEVDVTVRNSQKRKMRLPQALYLRTLSEHRDALLAEMQKKKTPRTEQFREFMQVQREINALAAVHVIRELKINADSQSLLAQLEAFGPEVLDADHLENPRAVAQAQDRAEFYRTYILPEKIVDQFNLDEFARVQGGMDAYLDIVNNDILHYEDWRTELEGMLVDNKALERRAIDMRVMIGEAAFFVPEWTLGWGRFAGLDYAELFGQKEGLDNLREVQAFRSMEEDIQSATTIFAEQNLALGGQANAVRAAMAKLHELREMHPPGECKEGQLHNGVPYEEIERLYAEATEKVRQEHKQYGEYVDQLFVALEKNMGFHVNRMAQNRLVDSDQAPNAMVGVGITAAELMTPVAWWYGGKRGLRAVPGIAQATGLGWTKTSSATWRSWAAKRLVNIPMRILNAPTRLLIDNTPLRFITPRSRLDATPSEEQFLRRQMQQLRERVTGGGTGESPAPRDGPGTRSGQEALERVSQNRAARKALEQIADIEQQIAAAQSKMEQLLQQRATAELSEEAFNRASNEIRDELIRLNANDAAARVSAARAIMRRRFLPMWPSQSRAIVEAHRAATIVEKKTILEAAKFKPNFIRDFLECGVCGDSSEGMRRLAGVVEATTEVADDVATTWQPVKPAATTGLKAANAGVRSRTTLPDEVTPAAPASRLGTALTVLGVAAQGYFLYRDIDAVQRAEQFAEEAEKAREGMVGDLDAMVKKGVLTKKKNAEGETEYWYGDKVSISMKSLEKASKIALDSANTHLAATAAGTAVWTTLLVGAWRAKSIAQLSNPIGWAALVIEVTIHARADTWERSEYFKFVEHAPLWLIDKFDGTAGLIGISEEDLFDESVYDSLIYVFGFEGEKTPEIRKKLFFTIFTKYMQREHPLVYSEIIELSGGKEDVLDRLFEAEFKSVIGPMFIADLQTTNKRADLRRRDLKNFKIDEVLLQTISPEQMDASMNVTMNILVQHLREKQYIEAVRTMEQDPSRENARRVYTLGSRYSLGKRLIDQDQAIAQNGGKTRPELLATRIGALLDRATGGGTWMAAEGFDQVQTAERAMKANPRLSVHDAVHKSGEGQFVQSIPVMFDAFSGEKISREDAIIFSRHRNFWIDTEGIAGLSHAQGGSEHFWFKNAILRDGRSPRVPDVAGLYPKSLRIDRVAYIDEWLVERLDELNDKHNELIALQKELEPLDEALAKKFVTRIEMEDDKPKVVYPYGGPPTEQEIVEVAMKIDEFTQEFQTFEAVRESLSALIESETRRTDILRNEASDPLGPNSIYAAESNAELADSLFANVEHQPYVLVSGEHTSEQHGESLYDKAANFVSNHPEKEFGSKHLLGMHIQHMDRSGERRAFVTYMYRRPQVAFSPEPKPEDVRYVQIAYSMPAGSYQYTPTMPIVSDTLSYLREDQDVLLDLTTHYMQEDQQEKAVERVASMTLGERMYRSGQNIGELTQIDRNLWGVRSQDGTFMLIKRDSRSGKMLCKVQTVETKPRLSMKESSRRWLNAIEAYDSMGSQMEVQLTDSERAFGEELAERLQPQGGDGWQELPDAHPYIEKFNLNGPVAAFNAIALPDGVLQSLQEQGVDIEVNHAQDIPGAPLDQNQQTMLNSHLENFFQMLPVVGPEQGQIREDVMQRLEQRLMQQENLDDQALRYSVGEVMREIDLEQRYPFSLYEIESSNF